MTQLNIYLILSKDVPQRLTHSTRTLQWIKQIADVVGIAVKFHSLAQPTAEEIEGFLHQESTKGMFEKRLEIQSDLRDDAVYKGFIKPLNIQQVSNYERHRMAYFTIQEASAEEYHLIMEDDFYILPMMESTWKEMLTLMKTTPSREVPVAWFGIVRELTAQESFKWIPDAGVCITQSFPLLPSKEAYLCHPRVAKQLYEYTHFIQMDMRHTLSRWIYTQKTVADGEKIPMLHPSKRIGFDGSKLGIYPSTVHPNNLLVFNKEYMDLLQLMNAGPDQKTRANVVKLFKLIENLRSPDAMHLYAVLMYQLGNMEDANTAFRDAIHEMVVQKGLLTRQSELLHNAIEFYKHYQSEEIKDALTKLSKYTGISQD